MMCMLKAISDAAVSLLPDILAENNIKLDVKTDVAERLVAILDRTVREKSTRHISTMVEVVLA